MFKKFLLSPYFNEDSKMIPLYLGIEKVLTKPERYDKQKLWKASYPHQKKYDDGLFRLRMSNLLKLGEKFLFIQHQERKEVETELVLMKILSDRKLDKHYAFYERKLKLWLDQNPEETTDVKKTQLELEIIIKKHNQDANRKTGKNNLDIIHKKLDEKYILDKLRHLCEVANFIRARNAEINIGLGNEIIQLLPHSQYFKEASIQTYYHIYSFLQEENIQIEQFEKLFELITENRLYFNTEEKYDIFTYLQNICIRKINSGENTFLNYLLNVYNKIIDLGILKEANTFTPWMYKNIITAGLLVGNFEFTNNFIEEYTPFMPEKEKENAYYYNMANLNFYKKDYDATISILNKVEFTDVTYELAGRWLLIRTFYEQDELQVLDSLLSSFRIYLLRQKLIIHKTKRQYLNLIRYIQKMIKIPLSEINKTNTLLEKIEKDQNVVNKKWLVEKLKEKGKAVS